MGGFGSVPGCKGFFLSKTPFSALPSSALASSRALTLLQGPTLSTVPAHSRFQKPSKCLQERSKCLPGVLRTANSAHHYDTLGTFSKIALYALQMLLGCLLAALVALWDALWAQLAVS